LSFNRTVIYKFGASDEKLLATRPNHIIFWEAISWAVDAGFQELDFGRTDFPNQGLRQFKTAWGAVEEPLVYTTFGRAAREHESGALQVLGPLIRHSPTPVCRVLGKVLYKYAA
jgi:CelD/BcsL family acetyltransferase involved in cellulose biosynthesis